MTVTELTAAMLQHFTELSGYAIAEGSEFSLRTTVLAAQLSALYDHLDWIVRQCFPQSAEGPSLDRHAQLRGLARLSGTCASGQIVFGRDEAGENVVVIPAGTVCLTEGLIRFETLTEGVIEAGTTQVSLPARAVSAGSAGNVFAGRITMMSLPPSGCAWCRNPAAMTGGRDEESDAELRARVLSTYARLPNGANAAYYESEALSRPGVAAVNVLPRVNGRGSVGVVVAGVNGMPSEALLAEVAAHLESRREIAVDVTVKAPVPVEVPVSVRVEPTGTLYEAQAAVETALLAHFSNSLLGKGLRRNDLDRILYDLPQVKNYRIDAPGDDLAACPGVLPVAASIEVSALT